MRLTYKTKKPRKGYSDFQAEATHKIEFGDRLPDRETERKALDIVNNSLQEMLYKLHELGYDYTDARFSIRKF